MICDGNHNEERIASAGASCLSRTCDDGSPSLDSFELTQRRLYILFVVALPFPSGYVIAARDGNVVWYIGKAQSPLLSEWQLNVIVNDGGGDDCVLVSRTGRTRAGIFRLYSPIRYQRCIHHLDKHHQGSTAPCSTSPIATWAEINNNAIPTKPTQT